MSDQNSTANHANNPNGEASRGLNSSANHSPADPGPALEVLPPVEKSAHEDAIDQVEQDLLKGMLADHLQLSWRMAQIRNYGMALQELEAAKLNIEQLARISTTES